MSDARCFLRLAALVCLAVFPTAADAQRFSKTQLTEGDPNLAKVSSHLLRARALDKLGLTVDQITTAVPTLEYRDGLPEVAVRLDRLTPDLVKALVGRGLVIESFHLDYARAYGRVDPADLGKLAALPEVVTIQPMPRKFTRVGSASNQADITMNADDVRSLFGYDGTGVEVGVLSDSFRDLSPGTLMGTGCTRTVTLTSSQTSGNLPASVVSLDDGPGGGSDEARAIGELIFDIAPGTTFFFHSAFNSVTDFADAITELRGCGADLIVDDIGVTGQAFFQDDIIAQAAQAAVDAGVPYFSSAGNDSTFGVDDSFIDPDPIDDFCSLAFGPDGHDLHDFDPGPGVDQFAEIKIPEGCNLFAELQWDQPFDSIGSSPGSATDLDLWLLDSAVDPDSVLGANVLDSSVSSQGSAACTGPPAGDPIEQVSYTNTGTGTMSAFLAVDGCCSGAQTDRFRVITLSFNCPTTVPPWDFEDGMDGGSPDPSENPIFVDPQIWGHPAGKDVIAVGATFYGEIFDPEGFPPGVINPPSGQFDVNDFSSLGGDIPFFFDTDGDPFAGGPEHRFKPEVTGPDGTNNSFFGIDFGFDSDSDPNFSGTSAAAPNSAGIAALILDATDLKINPLPLKQLLRQSAIDMEGTGLDPLSGDGFTDALRPISSLDPSTTPLIDDLEFDLDGGAFFSSPPTGGQQRLQANNSILYEDGDFSGLDAFADSHIFADGFESGDTSSWSSSVP